ncbi:MAG: RNA polymerase sigma-70 factor, ECF subfamily [bacterium P3]|nr:MAG: RNA polymerase sigma-70 factor, ECF subfamily [bacterium P3]KWW42767.1 MAG: RNA polymerase sigma-70 factor, ECF subfamily [bacterium F083]
MTKQLHHGFLDMLDQCRGTILKLCLMHTDRHPDSVSDLYQEIVCNLWCSYPQYRGLCCPNTWVYRIALNTVYMQYRSRRRMPRLTALNDALSCDLADNGGDEMVEVLYGLIDRLDKDEKTLLTLYIDRVPQSNIADIFEISEVAVNRRINRLKMKLRQLRDSGG